MRVVFVCAVLTAMFAGCVSLTTDRVAGSGDVVTSQRSVGPFDSIAVKGSPRRVEVTVGSPRSITVVAQKNIAELIETTATDGTLRIADRKPYRSAKEITVRVVVPNLSSFTIYGSSDVALSGIKGPSLDLSITGAGNIDASGAVDRLTLNCSGAGNADLKNLRVGDAVVHLSGVGNASMNVAKTLDVSIAGVGSVNYRGDPRIIHRSISGIGTLSHE